MRSHSRVLLSFVVLATTVGCGAKTGLYTPDGGENASLDAGVDAPITDAAVDCLVIPLDGGPVEVDIAIEAEVGAADIAFVIDTTASMQDELSRIRERLRDVIAPAIRDAIPDSRLAVASFEDFPVPEYGAATDRPYELWTTATSDISLVQAAVNAITLGDGRDLPESQVEAIYQLVTGAGRGSYVPVSAGCPGGGFGSACFRRDALPVALLFTDNDFHNGPRNANPYGSDVRPAPATYDEMVEVANGVGLRVIGFDSTGGARRHVQQLSTDTGALTPDGRPLYYNVGAAAERLDTSVVDAIRTLASNFVQDVDAVIFDGDPTDGIDALELVESFLPSRAEPMNGIERIDGSTFVAAQAGTRLYWVVTIRNDAVVPGPRPRRVRLEVVFRGDERRRIGRTFIDLVIPGADGSACEELDP
ncbi:MAG: VWA domain-containing protein [Sandaracinus sp.]|nr:VWA domain-containing protein [Myxococcales bacterium]MCB9599849.1 VWA domain-containing protein [Sandaracinus sp.]MCB9632556.1 VWA domain-containing protein [Sandaracinus sp.]